MFGLSEPHYNICKQAARRCSDELEKAIRDSGKTARARAKAYSELAGPCIDKHHKQVSTLMPRLTFAWLIGHLNDRFGHDDGEYE